MKRLSIVVVTWNNRGVVRECLESIQACCLEEDVEVIVVDNLSSDGTQELIKERFPFVRLIENRRNEGFARANNAAMRLATGKYVCLVNSDVKVLPGCVRLMIEYLDEHPQVGLVGPQMLGREGWVNRSYMRFPTIWRSLCNSLGLHGLIKRSKWFSGIMMTDFDNGRTSEVEVLNGWFLMAPMSAIAQVGMLDERFFMYGEDIDWCYRFHRCGWKTVYLSTARSVHYGGASSSADPTRFYIEMQRANIAFWRKYHGGISSAIYVGTARFHQIVRIAGYGIRCLAGGASGRVYRNKVRRSVDCLFASWANVTSQAGEPRPSWRGREVS